MQPATDPAHAPSRSSWKVTREGTRVAFVEVRHDGGNIVVSADVEGEATPHPYRFPTLEAAEAFTTDLMASFAYLGCDVSRA
jgi:hypothetical protein